MIKRVIGFTNPAYLSLRQKQMVVRLTSAEENEAANGERVEKTATIPIEDIGVVVLDNSQVTITQGLIAALLDNNVAIVNCDEHHLPVGLTLPLSGHFLQQERWSEQINASEPLKKQMWQQTVQQKIRNQAALLRRQDVEVRNMQKWAVDVRSGDTENMEARAAAYYWKKVFPQLPDFTRDRYEAPPNNLLNYGYAVVRAMVARSLVAAGLLPTLGIHHHNRYNAYCLADDIMEPYRPYVDEMVIEMLQWDGTIDEISKEHKLHLLSLPVKEVRIDGHRSPMQLAIQSTAQSVQKCFAGEIRKILYPEL